MSNMQVFGLVIMMLLMMELATSVTFDYYKLALQWPPEVCATGRCPPGVPIPTELFTIHGVWPSNWPPNEDLVSIGLPSNAWSIEDVQKELMNAPPPSADMLTGMWPPLYEPTNPWPLWSWEWNNHGTIIGPPVTSPAPYFRLSIRLFFLSNFTLGRLRHQGIEPSNDITKWTRADEFQQKAGYNPTLICDPTPVPPFSTYRLIQIHYCFATTSFDDIPTQIPCIDASLDTCGGPGGNITLRAP